MFQDSLLVYVKPSWLPIWYAWFDSPYICCCALKLSVLWSHTNQLLSWFWCVPLTQFTTIIYAYKSVYCPLWSHTCLNEFAIIVVTIYIYIYLCVCVCQLVASIWISYMHKCLCFRHLEHYMFESVTAIALIDLK